MRRLKHYIFSVIFITFSLVDSYAQDLSVCTLNVRWDNKGDGDNQWENRKENIVDFINYYAPDVIGLQEALIHQIQYLDSALVDYSWVGVGRDDGKEAGEFCPVFYRQTKFETMDSGTLWLSESPQTPGLGWDAACSRICTYLSLKSKDDQLTYSIFNTHFDHVGKEARMNSASLIVDQMKSMSSGRSSILIGDFNDEPHQLPIQHILKEGFADAYDMSPIKFGSEGTFNGFNYDKVPSRRIDYVFVTEDVSVNKYRVLSDLIGGRYLSDHFPVLVTLTLEK